MILYVKHYACSLTERKICHIVVDKEKILQDYVNDSRWKVRESLKLKHKVLRVSATLAAAMLMLTSCTYSMLDGDKGSSAQSSSQQASSLPPVESEPPEVESAPPELPETPVRPAISAQYEDIAALSAEPVTWGPGSRLDENGRPEAPVQLQEKYGKYGAYFIGPNEGKKMYLTFDEGYENGYTEPILDTLKEKRVSAVFFITYPYAKSSPQLVQRMLDEGHVVGNHSTSHPVGGMPTLTLDETRTDIMNLHDYVLQNFGYEMWLFRPPEGAFSEQTLALTHSLGYLSVMWSFAYKDWDVNAQPGYDKALAATTKAPHPGGIYLLHAVSKDNAAILGAFIDQLRADGFEFAPFDLAGQAQSKPKTESSSERPAQDASKEQ